jgi:hypothetical protein
MSIMEWVLQVVDEIDDALAAVRHRCAGVALEMGSLFASGVAAAALWAVFLAGR